MKMNSNIARIVTKFIASLSLLLFAELATAQAMGGNNNYVLANNCSNVDGLTVSFQVTQAMIATVFPGGGGAGTPDGGFAMQLNANPPSGAPVTWMQYGIIIENNEALGFIQYWNQTGINNHGQPVIVNLPSNTISQGFLLKIQLSNDSNGNVIGTTFSVTNNSGQVYPLQMPMPTYPNTNTPVLSPIQSFQLDIVGPIDWENSIFNSGAGYLDYSVSSGQLSANTTSCQSGNYTGETSNTAYGPLTPASGSLISQNVTTPVYGRSTTAFSAFRVEGPTGSDPYSCLNEDNGAVVNNCSYPVDLNFGLPLDGSGNKAILVQDYWNGSGSDETFYCQSFAYTGTEGPSTVGAAIFFNAPVQEYNSNVDAGTNNSVQLICWGVPPGGGVANLNWTP